MKWWTNYWFRPAPLLDLAILRISAVAVALFLEHLPIISRGEYHVGPQLSALRRMSDAPESLYNPLPMLQLFLLPFGDLSQPTFEILELVWWVTLVGGLCALVGFITNLSLVVFVTGSVFLQAFMYSFRELHHPEAVMMVALAALALSPSGRMLSVDVMVRRFIRGRSAKPTIQINQWNCMSPFARWPILLIQWFFVLMYLSGVYSKLTSGGLDWINGYTLQYYMMQDHIRKGSPLALYIAQFHYLLLFAQYIVIFIQSTFSLAVIFPHLRWIYVPLGFTFHTVILFTLKAEFFQWMALYVVFIPWASAFELMQRYRPIPAARGSDS